MYLDVWLPLKTHSTRIAILLSTQKFPLCGHSLPMFHAALHASSELPFLPLRPRILSLMAVSSFRVSSLWLGPLCAPLHPHFDMSEPRSIQELCSPLGVIFFSDWDPHGSATFMPPPLVSVTYHLPSFPRLEFSIVPPILVWLGCLPFLKPSAGVIALAFHCLESSM